MHPRLIREQKTVDKMIGLYCHNHHATSDGLCGDCQALRDYSQLRLQKCPYQEKTCAKCPTHCYQKTMREKIREVMRHAGPRMLKQHPGLAILHLLDGFRKPVTLKKNRNR